jgi:threonine dehydrogenase-like Zn-dependent dehydrogenase
MTPGGGAIGRVEAVGPDAVSLKPGQLVLTDTFVRGRDDPNATILQGAHNGGEGAPEKKLMDGAWRNSSWAEFMILPLENAFPLDEERLIHGLGYEIPDLCLLTNMVTSLSGFTDIDLKAGETVIVAPATGAFGGAAVTMAMALGARVIAAARNEESLNKMKDVYGPTARFATVVLKGGDGKKDTEALKRAFPGGVDALMDWSPPAAAKSTHIRSCILALNTNGRCSLMGWIHGEISLPYGFLIFKSIQIKARFMHSRDIMTRLIKTVEAGNAVLGKRAGVKLVGSYGLEEIEQAFTQAEAHPGWDSQVIIAPNASKL